MKIAKTICTESHWKEDDDENDDKLFKKGKEYNYIQDEYYLKINEEQHTFCIKRKRNYTYSSDEYNEYFSHGIKFIRMLKLKKLNKISENNKD